MCEVAFDDYCSVWSEKPVTARKPNRCDSCGTAIQRGEAYLRHFSVFDGYSSNAALCFVCWLVRAEFNEAHGVNLHPESVLQYLEECVDDGDDDSRKWRPHIVVLRNRSARARAARTVAP